MSDCACGLDGEEEACIGGRVYSPCPEASCGGVCESSYDCVHGCHAALAEAAKALSASGELAELDAAKIAQSAMTRFALVGPERDTPNM